MGKYRVVACEASEKGKLRVAFDNGMCCPVYRSEARQFALEEGMILSEETYDTFLYEVIGKRAKKRAMHLLEQMDRTEQQLRQKLMASEYPQECIEEAIAYVKSFHYLDDERYAQVYVRYRQEKMSRGKLRQKLLAKGVAGNIIDRVLEEEYEGDELCQIRSILQKKKFYDTERSDREFQRVYQYLMRRGFCSSDILRCMKTPERDRW